MNSIKNIVVVGVISGVVLFTFFRNFSKKMNRALDERKDTELLPETV
jgi:hypothetical protein